MKTKLLLTTLFSLLLLGCTSQPSITDSNSTVVSSSSSSADISKGETSSFSSTGSSNSDTSEKLDYTSLNNLLSEAIKLKEKVHFSSESKGDLLIAEDANEVDENKYFVTLNMVKLLDESITYCEPVEKFTSKQKIKEAEGILSHAIFSFIPKKGKKKNISLDELNYLIETAEEKLSSVKYLPDDEGEIIIAENASEVLNTTYFVTSKMYKDLSDSVNSCFPLDKFDNQKDIDQACNKIIIALNYFVVERGTKTEKSIDDIVNDLKSGINKNVISYKRGEEDHAIIWNKEMIPPSREKGNDDFKTETYGDYLYEFVTPDKGNFYYDVNKKEQSGIDRLMCYAAVSANQLHFF
ncbi:MAG: IdeS/Mac family cysteine endopeptidase, partial [Bacilli bacterium]|nr:IdeS/Mac family cysteine endopeptidase [Bacilli bacterium]